MALVTRFHSNALVERRHVLEGHDMKATKSRSCSRIATFASILLAVVLVAGCTSTRDQIPTRDELLANTMSADNYGIEFIGGEIGALTGDIGILTTSTGYLTPLTTSQLAGSIAARFETLCNIGIALKPLNDEATMSGAVNSREIQAARLMTDVCLACSQGPIASVENIAEHVGKQGKLTAQDSTYLQTLAGNLGKVSDLIVRYWKEADSSDTTARTTVVQQVTDLCTRLKGQ
jgi:hypothetical protein